MKYITKMLCILFLLITAVGCIFSGCDSDLENGIILEGVSVAGVDVGGMSKEDALQAVQLATEHTYTETPMQIRILDETVALSPALTGVKLDAEAAIEAAYALGRTGTKAEKQAIKVQAMTVGVHTDLSACLNLSKEDLLVILEKACESYTSSELTQATYDILGEQPDLNTEEPPEQTQTLVITMGTPMFRMDLDALCVQVYEAYSRNTFQMEYVCEKTEPEPLNLEQIHTDVSCDPVEAVMDTETFEVSDHAYGYGFDLEQAAELIAGAGYGETVEIPFQVYAPSQTKEALASLLFRDVLAEGSAYSASTANRATNLRLACEALDGIVLLPGEELSYNNALGERTPEKGWKPAGTYVAGETVDTYGGGICQPSSVLYYCALLADLKIVHRACHQYISSYVDPGMDATVYWDGVDFIFANNTEYPLRIEAKADGGNVEIRLIGTDTKDYYVKMEYEVLRYRSWEDEEVEVHEDDNPKGYKDGQVISTPYTGCSVVTYKCRYNKADDALIERVKEAESEYESRNRKTVKLITDEPEETEPEETEPEETEPEETEPEETKPTKPPKEEEEEETKPEPDEEDDSSKDEEEDSSKDEEEESSDKKEPDKETEDPPKEEDPPEEEESEDSGEDEDSESEDE